MKRAFAAFKGMAIVFPLACLAALAMIFISEGAHWQSMHTLDELGQLRAGSAALESLQREVLVAETAQRGFLLTGSPQQLKAHGDALERIDRAFRALDPYFPAEAESRSLFEALQRQIHERLGRLALAIRLREQGDIQASLDAVTSGIDDDQMATIRSIIGKLLALESAEVGQARAEIHRTLTASRIGVAALSGIGLLALFLYLRQTAALRSQQQARKQAMQAQRDRLEMEVAHRTAELTELALHLQTAREDERSRLARDLHDELGALLTSAKLDAARIKSRLLASAAAPEALERLSHLVARLNSIIAMKRRIIEDLRPSALANLGLVEALAILARESSEHADIEVITALQPVPLTPASELVVYRIVQEALTNISKYAKARRAWITLAPVGGEVLVAVRDDGLGFDPQALSGSAHGLTGMRFRVEAEKGRMVLRSAPGAGTSIEVRLPACATPLAGPAGESSSPG